MLAIAVAAVTFCVRTSYGSRQEKEAGRKIGAGRVCTESNEGYRQISIFESAPSSGGGYVSAERCFCRFFCVLVLVIASR